MPEIDSRCATLSHAVLCCGQALHMPHSYYSVALSRSWRLIVLDTTEMSLHSGYPEVCHSTTS
jgi:hypothetical protein